MKKNNTKFATEKIAFTKDGYEKVKKEREDLIVERKVVLSRLKEARAMGDLSENGYYRAAKSQLRSIDHTLSRLGAFLHLGVIAKPDKGIVGIGSKVEVFEGQKKITFHIVGKYEADPTQKKVSFLSPIGDALMGKKIGDKVNIQIPNGKLVYKIEKIS